MNRNTFFKKCLALVGCGALINTVKAEEPVVATPPNTITLNQLHITDGKSTYVLVVQNGALHINKLKLEKESLPENSNPLVVNQTLKPNSFMFCL